MVGKIRIKWIKSAIGSVYTHKRTIKALGFTRLNQEMVKDASPQVLGMVYSVRHLLDCEEVKS